MIVNLTGNKLVLMTHKGEAIEYPKSTEFLTLPRVYVQEDNSIDGDLRIANDYIRRITSRSIKVENIPPQVHGTIYVVRRMVFDAISCMRDDFATPGRVLKDIDGRPMACEALIVAE